MGISFLNSSLRLTPENEEFVNYISHYDFANMSLHVLELGADELVPNSHVPALNLRARCLYAWQMLGKRSHDSHCHYLLSFGLRMF